ncbi:hypothetical protein LUZ60_009337 [Juncus effusus]|nr:hypothetical protein LUZ60_009337 [Juncus effusus]
MAPSPPQSSLPVANFSPPSGRQVTLPERVEAFIEEICKKQNKDPPDNLARQNLSQLSEEKSIDILGKMAKRQIQHFSKLLMSMVAKSRNAEGLALRGNLANSPHTPDRNIVNSTRMTSSELKTGGVNRNRKSMVQTRLNFESFNVTRAVGNSSDNPIDLTSLDGGNHPKSVEDIETNNELTSPHTPKYDNNITTDYAQMGFESPVNNIQTGPVFAPKTPCNVQNSDRELNQRSDMASKAMLALGELEFRKRFLIRNYLRGDNLEEHATVGLINSLKCVDMEEFESIVWSKFGHKIIPETERIRHKNADWDSDKTHVYHCHVDLRGRQTFKGPYLENERTHLQRVLGDDNVLQVKFEEVTSEDKKSFPNSVIFDMNYCMYHSIAEEGIQLGLRRYRFYVYKDAIGGKKRLKNPNASSVTCYFVRTESGWEMDNCPYILSGLDFYKARLPFMHVHTVSLLPKYMDRFSLILSKTVKLDVDLSTVNVIDIGDIECKDENGNVVRDKNGEPLIHSDGTGLISEDLAMLCPRIYKGKYDDMQTDQHDALSGSRNSKRQRSDDSEPPLLIQVRLFYKGSAVKGTLLLDKRLAPRTICIRPSMIKVKGDPYIMDIESLDSLEIVTTTNKPHNAKLSRYLILLLHYGGVSADFFLNLLDKALNDIKEGKYSSKGAIQAALNNSGIDEDSIAVRMIYCGIPLNEPFLQSHLCRMMEGERKGLREGRIPVAECYYLMGTVDPTGKLKPDEVCVILENGQVSGDVLVYKHPGLHVGDIHVLKATYVREIEEAVGNSKYAIIFPTVGPRSLADEMANSDFDGDMYWVSRNLELLKSFKQSKPWFPPEEEPKKVEPPKGLHGIEEKERERMLFGEFLKCRFKPSYAVSLAADTWMRYMDRLLTPGLSESERDSVLKKINRLVNIYYDAVDAPKTGKDVQIPADLKVDQYPHFMEKAYVNDYNSTSVLGKIYDRVKLFEEEKVQSTQVWRLPCFDDGPPQSCIKKWETLYNEYLKEAREMSNEDSVPKGPAKAKKFQDMFAKYKEILYGAAEFELSPRSQKDICDEALAVYQIVYSNAEKSGVGKCGFAWKVAGHALCQLFMVKTGQISLGVSLEMTRQMFGR